MIIKKLSPIEWAELSELAHKFCFGYIREASFDRIDFALLGVSEFNTPMGFITMRELNASHVYWQHGGAFPDILGTIKTYPTLLAGKRWCAQFYESVSAFVENTNVVMLKLAMKIGFRIVGVKHTFNTTMVELFLNLKE